MTEPVRTQIVVEITARAVLTIPFDDQHYPGETVEQALETERNQNPEDMAQMLVEHMSLGEESVSLSWSVTSKEVQSGND